VRHQGQQSILKPFCTGHIPRLHCCRNLFQLFCGASLGLQRQCVVGDSARRTRQQPSDPWVSWQARGGHLIPSDGGVPIVRAMALG
jgi:hypothetical protein